MSQNGALKVIPKYPSIALLSLIIAIATSYFVNRGGANETDQTNSTAIHQDSAKSETDAGHWHEKYVADHCERCPDCCVTINHCEGCPGPDCDCIKTANGGWVLSPETGDSE